MSGPRAVGRSVIPGFGRAIFDALVADVAFMSGTLRFVSGTGAGLTRGVVETSTVLPGRRRIPVAKSTRMIMINDH